MEIRGKTISYSTYILKRTLEREEILKKEILHLKQNLTQDSIQQFEDKHNELEEIKTTRLKGQCIRSKENWIDQGEKPTKYFANLESRNYINKKILVIEKENGSIIRNQQEILSETEIL